VQSLVLSPGSEKPKVVAVDKARNLSTPIPMVFISVDSKRFVGESLFHRFEGPLQAPQEMRRGSRGERGEISSEGSHTSVVAVLLTTN